MYFIKWNEIIHILIIYIHFVKPDYTISERTDERCINERSCAYAGIGGHVLCIRGSCACINNSSNILRENPKISGCYKKSTINETCVYDEDCSVTVEESICSTAVCPKQCKCPPDREYNNGTCILLTNQSHGTNCFTNTQCNETLKCIDNTCKCEEHNVFYKDKCVDLKQHRMCANDSNCDDSHHCEKNEKSLEYGFCTEIGPKLSEKFCSTKRDCPDKGHVDCIKNKCTCILSSKNRNNGCYLNNTFGQTCTSTEDCNYQKSKCSGENDNKVCSCSEDKVFYQDGCVNIKCLKREKCKVDNPCTIKNAICVLDKECDQKFCECPEGTGLKDSKCKLDCKEDKQCESVLRNGVCVNSSCSCPKDTVELFSECLVLEGRKYGDYCHAKRKCQSPNLKCILPDNSSILGVCGCAYSIAGESSWCTYSSKENPKVVNNGCGTFIHSNVYKLILLIAWLFSISK